MPKISVILQFRETGQTTPVELADGRVIGYTTRPPGRQFWQYEMTVEQFNELAPKIYTGRFAPGHEPIPQVVIVDDEADAEKAKAAQAVKDAQAEKQREQDRIAAEAQAAAEKEAAELEELRKEVEALEAADKAKAEAANAQEDSTVQ